jgi:hypothetical protein
MVVFPETVTVQFCPETDVQPDHEPKLLLPAVVGAWKMYVEPELNVSENEVLPVVCRLVKLLP